MDNNQDFEDNAGAADDIAAAITSILVKAFSAKEGREPTAEEVEMLIEELTEERIESMLSGLGEAEVNGAVENEISDGGEDQEEEDDGESELKDDLAKECELAFGSATNNKRVLEEKDALLSRSDSANGDNIEVKKVKTAASTDQTAN